MLSQSSLFLAAQELAGIQARYANKGIGLSQAALCGSKDFMEWRHYPINDLVDLESGYEFYYHAHTAKEMPKEEHGHFHVFKRDQKNPDRFHHLIGIALNQKGLPVRLFTTNQWVTGETYVPSKKVLRSVKDFDMTVKGKLSPLAKWISAMMKLFYVEICTLVEGRDEKLAKLNEKIGNLEVVLESHKYFVLTQCKIDLMNRLSKHLLVEST